MNKFEPGTRGEAIAQVSLGEILSRRERLAIGQRETAEGCSRPVRHVTVHSGETRGEAPEPLRNGTILILPRDAARRMDAGGSGSLLGRWERNLSCLALAETPSIRGSLRRSLRKRGIPVFSSPYPAELLQSRLVGILRELAEGTVMVHGVLVDLKDCGLLLIGESGIGKTTCGLEIVARGYRWVADDAIVLQRQGDRIFGRPHPRTRNLIAIREQGILSADRLLGPETLLAETRVAAVVRMERQTGAGQASGKTRKTEWYSVLGLSLPCDRLVVSADPIRRAAGVTEMIRRWRLRSAETTPILSWGKYRGRFCPATFQRTVGGA